MHGFFISSQFELYNVDALYTPHNLSKVSEVGLNSFVLSKIVGQIDSLSKCALQGVV